MRGRELRLGPAAPEVVREEPRLGPAERLAVPALRGAEPVGQGEGRLHDAQVEERVARLGAAAGGPAIGGLAGREGVAGDEVRGPVGPREPPGAAGRDGRPEPIPEPDAAGQPPVHPRGQGGRGPQQPDGPPHRAGEERAHPELREGARAAPPAGLAPRLPEPPCTQEVRDEPGARPEDLVPALAVEDHPQARGPDPGADAGGPGDHGEGGEVAALPRLLREARRGGGLPGDRLVGDPRRRGGGAGGVGLVAGEPGEGDREGAEAGARRRGPAEEVRGEGGDGAGVEPPAEEQGRGGRGAEAAADRLAEGRAERLDAAFVVRGQPCPARVDPPEHPLLDAALAEHEDRPREDAADPADEGLRPGDGAPGEHLRRDSLVGDEGRAGPVDERRRLRGEGDAAPVVVAEEGADPEGVPPRDEGPPPPVPEEEGEVPDEPGRAPLRAEGRERAQGEVRVGALVGGAPRLGEIAAEPFPVVEPPVEDEAEPGRGVLEGPARPRRAGRGSHGAVEEAGGALAPGADPVGTAPAERRREAAQGPVPGGGPVPAEDAGDGAHGRASRSASRGPDPHEAALREVAEEDEEVLLGAGSGDPELGDDPVHQGVHRGLRLHPVPDPRADLVQAEVASRAQVHEDGLAPELAVEDLLAPPDAAVPRESRHDGRSPSPGRRILSRARGAVDLASRRGMGEITRRP